MLKLKQFTFQPFQRGLLRVDTHLNLNVTAQPRQILTQPALVEFRPEPDRRLRTVTHGQQLLLERAHTGRHVIKGLDLALRVDELDTSHRAT